MAWCNLMAILCAVIIGCSTWTLTSADDYTVGDFTGWVLNYDYSSWTSGKSFVVGDELVFNYAAGQHNVVEVSDSAFNSCSSSNPISTDDSGHTTITLTTSGMHYFICGIPGHCSGGMKLEVNVADSATTSAPPSPPSTSTTPTSNTTSATTSSGASIISPLRPTAIFVVLAALKVF